MKIWRPAVQILTFFVKLSCLLSVLPCISCLVGFTSVIRVDTLPHVRNPWAKEQTTHVCGNKRRKVLKCISFWFHRFTGFFLHNENNLCFCLFYCFACYLYGWRMRPVGRLRNGQGWREGESGGWGLGARGIQATQNYIELKKQNWHVSFLKSRAYAFYVPLVMKRKKQRPLEPLMVFCGGNLITKKQVKPNICLEIQTFPTKSNAKIFL